DRRGSQETILAAACGFRRDVLHLSCGLVKAGDFAAVNDIWIQRVWRDITIFFSAYGAPIAPGDRPVIAARRNACRTALLLPAVNPVGKLIVCDDVIKLRCRLIVPTAPGLAASNGDACALIAG